MSHTTMLLILFCLTVLFTTVRVVVLRDNSWMCLADKIILNGSIGVMWIGMTFLLLMAGGMI